jgi:catechol 2,3-dioxygenase-like lactoylglutathione lyase family enzyme
MASPRLWYVNVFVSDLKRAVEFYRDTLGLPLQFQEDQFGYASFAPEGIRFGVARVDAAAPESPSLLGRHTGIGWGVPDLDAVHQQLKAKGVRFTMAPTKQPWGGFMATFADPDGNLSSTWTSCARNSPACRGCVPAAAARAKRIRDRIAWSGRTGW